MEAEAKKKLKISREAEPRQAEAVIVVSGAAEQGRPEELLQRSGQVGAGEQSWPAGLGLALSAPQHSFLLGQDDFLQLDAPPPPKKNSSSSPLKGKKTTHVVELSECGKA